MEEYRRGLFTDAEKAALEDEDVKFALERVRVSATPFAIHRLNSALAAAGISDRRRRENLIKTLRRTRRWGGS